MRRRTIYFFASVTISVAVLLMVFSQLSFNSAEEDTIERCRDTNYEYDICPTGMLTCMSQSLRCQTYLDLRCPEPCIVRSYDETCTPEVSCWDDDHENWYKGNPEDPAGIYGHCKIKCEDPAETITNNGGQ